MISIAQRVPDMEVEKSEDFKEIHVDGLFGGLDPNGAKFTVYTQEREPKMKESGKPGEMVLDKIKYELQAELHMSPVQFKSIAKWMEQKLEEYESQFGEIEAKPIQQGKTDVSEKEFG